MGKALAYRPLSDRLQDAQINLGPMTREELESAIRKPAEKVQLEFEPMLVRRILNDVGDEPGNLPLLEFVLKELWDKRRGHVLLSETYDAIGGLQGAVATKADEFFKGFSSPEQTILQRVFLRIVRPAKDGLDTRRRALAETEARHASERALFAEQQTRRAEEQARIAESRRLAAESSSALIRFPQRSLLLAVEALRLVQPLHGVRVAAAEQSLREALAFVGGRPLVIGQSGTSAIGVSQDNHWLVTGSDGDDDTARLWDLRAKDPAASPVVLRGHEGRVSAVAISPDNHWLVTGSADRTARLWPLQINEFN